MRRSSGSRARRPASGEQLDRPVGPTVYDGPDGFLGRCRPMSRLDRLGADLPPRYNVAPSQPVAVVRAGADGRSLSMFRWGLVPPWADDPKVGYALFNARAESVATKPSFRAAAQVLPGQCRGLVVQPQDGRLGYLEGRETHALPLRLQPGS